ncbi:MAG: transcriptional repressor LexA [Alphaproteobacteria bacterium]|nr:transcriptional repressor LexA [Alphaproteobacteria bacterium]
MLTRKQYELLVYIKKHLDTHGVSPSFDEMKEALALKSKSGIHRLITGLEERGFIRRLAHRARALEVVRLPENHLAAIHGAQLPASPARPQASNFQPNVIRGDFRQQLAGAVAAANASAATLPLYGKIAAGQPIEAVVDSSETVDVPGDMVGRGEHFALTVAGDSMIEAGILDGDTAIIRRSDTADNGEIVVALVDNSEVTLKRLRRRGASIALEPANRAYETRIFGPDRVRIQGRLVGLIRRYA